MAARLQESGFTLVETTFVSALTGLLVLLLANAWYGVGRPLSDNVAQGRIGDEAQFAVASLRRDVGGSLTSMSGRSELKKKGKLTGKFVPDPSQFWLCFDGGANPNGEADWGLPDTVIVYRVENGTLLRENQALGLHQPIARYVNRIEVRNRGEAIELRLMYKYRSLERTYTLVIRDP